MARLADAGRGDRRPPPDPAPLRALRGVLLTVTLLAGLTSVPMVRGALLERDASLADPSQPRALAGSRPAGPVGQRIFNAIDWGGYLGWRLAPADHIFADERYGLYTPQTFRDYARVRDARRAGRPCWQTTM